MKLEVVRVAEMTVDFSIQRKITNLQIKWSICNLK